MPPWAPGRDVFQASAEKAIAGLNPVLKRYVDGADVYVSDVPGHGARRRGRRSARARAARRLRLATSASASGAARASSRPCGRVFVYALNVARLAGELRRHRARDHPRAGAGDHRDLPRGRAGRAAGERAELKRCPRFTGRRGGGEENPRVSPPSPPPWEILYPRRTRFSFACP